MILWNVPMEISGEVRVRVSRNGFSDESDQNFSLCGIPANLEVTGLCSDDFMQVKWDAVTGATGYDVFYLGEKFMDSVGTTNLTEFDLPISEPLAEHWFSVRAVGDNGLRGKRAVAVKYDGGLLNCNLGNDVATTQLFSPSEAIAVCDPFDENLMIEVENTSMNDQTDLTLNYQLNNEPIVTENYNNTLTAGEIILYTFSTSINFPSSGTYELKTWSSIPNDEIGFNDTLTRSIIVNLGDVITPSLDLVEGFDSMVFPPEDWFSTNPDGDFGWERVSGITGADDNSNQAAAVRNRFYEDKDSVTNCLAFLMI